MPISIEFSDTCQQGVMEVLDSQVHISYQSINLGRSPAFLKDADGGYLLDGAKRRRISYQNDQVEPRFPLIVCRSRVRECLEMNLFLMHRATGKYAVKKSKTSDSVAFSEGYLAGLQGEGVSMKFVVSLAKDLRDFLAFLVDRTFCYEHVLAAPLAKDSVRDEIASLPIWQYQQYLIKRLSLKGKGRLAYSTATRRLGVVRHFYQWSYKRGCINHLPFSVNFKQLKATSRDGTSVLFGMPKPKGNPGHSQWVTNLSISRVYKQKADAPDELQPYSSSELVQLLSTDTAKHRTFGLFFKCAYLGGLRAFEVPQIDASDIFDPEEDRKNGIFKLYRVSIVRKGHKPVKVLITASLMSELYKYTLDPEWAKRVIKHQTTYGIDNPEQPLPLFLNGSGERMADDCCSSALRQVRREQRDKGLPVLKRGFHDLRATFGTYIVIQMVISGVPEARIKSTIMKLFSHESFSTSEDYLDFAKTLISRDEHGEMSVWVNDIYSDVDKMLRALDSTEPSEDRP